MAGRLQSKVDVPKLWNGTPGDALRPLGGGGRVVCMRDILVLNEMWAQDEIYILVGTSLGLNVLLNP
jgi:hypothetical protein